MKLCKDTNQQNDLWKQNKKTSKKVFFFKKFKIKVMQLIFIENILKKKLYLFSKRELYLCSKIQSCLFYSRGVTECTQPVEVVSYKIGVCKVSPSGKECRTEFERLNYNGRTSVVLCRPFTGRMHQIRVHLQYLGMLHFITFCTVWTVTKMYHLQR